MSQCQPTAEVRRIIRGMAKAKLEDGMTGAHDIVDSIHAAINEHTPLWKNEIAEIIAGIGEKPKATKSDLQQRLTQLRRDLKAAYGEPPAPSEVHRTTKRPVPKTEAEKAAGKNTQRQKDIRAQISKIDAQIRSGDFSKEPRPKPNYDATTQRLQAELEHARARADREVQRLEYKSQSRFYRAVSMVNAVYRAAILSSLTVFEHLIGASAWRAIGTVAEDVAGAGLRHLPGIREIDAAAPLEGGGFHGRGQIEGIKRVFSPETLKAMRDKLVKGQSDRAAMYGKEKPWSNHPLLDMVGHAHDVIKTPLEQLEFGRASYRITKNLRAQLARAGKSPAEIEKAMVTDSALSMINGRAYEASLAAKLQGKNAVVDWYTNALRALDRSGDVGAFFSGLFRLETPIVKIPANYAAEVFSYAPFGGLVKAISKSRASTREVRAAFKASDRGPAARSAFERGKQKALTPDVADYIMRNLKKQTVGAGLFAAGFLGYHYFGGLYRAGKGPANPDVEVGGVGPLSHHWAHAPAIGIAQMGAMTAWVMDQDQQKADDNGDENNVLASALSGLTQASLAIVLDIPVFDIPKDLEKLSRGGNSAAKLGGEKLAGFIPGAIQYFARRQDVDDKGEPIKRKPAGFTDQLKQAIPGLREEVPEAKKKSE